jgi:hypothetical protein
MAGWLVTNLAVEPLAGFPTKRNANGPPAGDQALETEALAAPPDRLLTPAATLRPWQAVGGHGYRLVNGEALGGPRAGLARDHGPFRQAERIVNVKTAWWLARAHLLSGLAGPLEDPSQSASN